MVWGGMGEGGYGEVADNLRRSCQKLLRSHMWFHVWKSGRRSPEISARVHSWAATVLCEWCPWYLGIERACVMLLCGEKSVQEFLHVLEGEEKASWVENSEERHKTVLTWGLGNQIWLRPRDLQCQWKPKWSQIIKDFDHATGQTMGTPVHMPIVNSSRQFSGQASNKAVKTTAQDHLMGLRPQSPYLGIMSNSKFPLDSRFI